MGAEESRPQTAGAPRSPSEKFLSDPMKSLGLVYYPEKDDEEEAEYIDKVAAGLYIGSIEGAADSFLLDRNKITHILNAENYESNPRAFRPKDYVYMLSDIPGNQTVYLRQYLPRSNKFIRDARQDDCSVLVHCRDGMTTSAALVLGYLVSEGMTLNAARARLDTVRPGVNVSKAYIQQLEDYAREVSKGGLNRGSVTPPPRVPASSLQQRYEGYDTVQARSPLSPGSTPMIPAAPRNVGSEFWDPNAESAARAFQRESLVARVEDGEENWSEQQYWMRQRDQEGASFPGVTDISVDGAETWDDYSYWVRERRTL